ncbi:amidase family protein [Rhodococcus aerolatus]
MQTTPTSPESTDPTDAEIARAGVAGRRAMLREGRTTAVGLLEASLRRIAALDPVLGAVQRLLPTARAEAQAADAARARGEDGPLLGIPVAVKDAVAVAGQVQSLGTASPQPPAAEDSTVVARLRAAGAVVVCTTRMPELALWPFTESPAFGATRNPWDPTRTPGGSSGGSSAAVASGMVAAAHASDGGGSIRVPAACCGLVGLKPGVGAHGLGLGAGHWQGLSTDGCVTRTVADQAAVLGVLADRPLAPAAPGRLLVAWSTATPAPQPVDPVVVDALHAVLGVLRELGHDVVPADPDLTGVQEAFLPRYLRGVAEDLATLADPSTTELRVRVPAAVGRRVPDRLLARAHRRSREAAARLATPPGGADLLLTPTLPGPVPRVGSLTGLRTLVGAPRRVPFTVPWNVTGQPALSVPAGLDADGLPLAVQLVGAPGSEELLLGVAAQLEGVLRWPDRVPPLG